MRGIRTWERVTSFLAVSKSNFTNAIDTNSLSPGHHSLGVFIPKPNFRAKIPALFTRKEMRELYLRGASEYEEQKTYPALCDSIKRGRDEFDTEKLETSSKEKPARVLS